MTSLPEFSFSHVGFYVTDIARMEDFYTRALGFTVTDRGENVVFLSRDPREHHQILLATGRPADLRFNPIHQISFRMAEFAGLREMQRRLKDEAITELAALSHGNALAVYFRDPEGNRIELFVDTPWYVQQPVRIPMDMNLSDRDLWQWAEAEARKLPDFKPVEEWRADIARRMRTAK